MTGHIRPEADTTTSLNAALRAFACDEIEPLEAPGTIATASASATTIPPYLAALN